MFDFRRLAAIDILFLGSKFTVGEYAVGVFFSAILGVFVVLRGHSFWQLILGGYLVSLGINYVPMLVYAVSITNKVCAPAVLAEELADKRTAMAKYRRLSLFLLVPLLVPILVLAQRQMEKPEIRSHSN